MSKRPNPKVFMLMTAGMAVLGGAGVYYCYSALGDAQDHVATLSKEARDIKDVQRDLTAAQLKLTDCQALLTHLEQGIPDRAFVPSMLAELERTGIQNGIQVTGVKPIVVAAAPKKDDGTTDKKAYEELNIEVKGTGKFADVRRFVSAMNAFPKIVAARTVSLTPKSMPGQDWSDNLDVVIDLRAYLFPNKDAVATTTAPAAGATGDVVLAPSTTKAAPASGATKALAPVVPVKGQAPKSGPTTDISIEKPLKEVKTSGR